MGRKTKRNILYDPKVWDEVNPENKELVEEFLEYLRSTDHAELTIYQYNNDLRIFLCYIYEHLGNKHFTEITKREYIRWQYKAINEYEWSPARLSRVRATISSLENYIEAFCDDVWPDYRPMIRKIPAPVKQAVREKTVFEAEELEEVLNWLMDTKRFEIAVALALAMYSGRRKQELPRFKLSFFEEKNVLLNSLYKSDEKIRTKGRGRNGKPLNVYVLKKNFDPWLHMWKQYIEDNHIETEWLLFDPNNPTKPVTQSRVDSWSRTISKYTEAHFGKIFYWHSQRHFQVSELSRAGLPSEIIKDIQGWNSVELVEVYRDIDAEDEFAKYFKDGEIINTGTKTIADL